MEAVDIRALVLATHGTITRHIDELTKLDLAIGDGDHGVNMKRGFDAVLADVDALAALPLNDALRAAGTRLVMTVGGASGPLLATFLLVFGQELNSKKAPDAFASAVDAVAKRGKAIEGEKTLLDVLFPLAAGLRLKQNCGQLANIANQAALATIPIKATKGRAAYLGQRSIGHMDPGARSVSLLMAAVANVVGAGR
ncbi:MAG: dihydroxyacetone kinase subunit DhaL [Notoacmeibacter sp.]